MASCIAALSSCPFGYNDIVFCGYVGAGVVVGEAVVGAAVVVGGSVVGAAVVVLPVSPFMHPQSGNTRRMMSNSGINRFMQNRCHQEYKYLSHSFNMYHVTTPTEISFIMT